MNTQPNTSGRMGNRNETSSSSSFSNREIEDDDDDEDEDAPSRRSKQEDGMLRAQALRVSVSVECWVLCVGC